ncbi:MAG: carbohydrate ABC transporter substrate-binding protein [Spirochaetota bacterium]|nr:MAG: carbohydrate ABC transporter substrate-binding protein [Spirochaetota bacterium]
MRSIKLLRVFICLAILFSVCGLIYASDKEEEVTLVFWWWGETELQGLTGWLDDTIAIFEEEHPNVTVEATLLDTLSVFSDFPTASAAGEPPDLQFAWNGIYVMEWAWLGYVEPLDEWIPKNELKHMIATPLSNFKGKQYRAGWYLFGHGWLYNKSLYQKAGVPESLTPPKTWDEWLEVCQILKDAGITPISLGTQDQLVGDWLISLFLIQQLDSIRDPIKLCVGELRWDDPRYYEYWVRIKELWDKGYINDDVSSLELYQAQDLFTKGDAAMTIAVGTIIPAMEKALGRENIGVMKTPTFGVGKLAEKDISYTQGVIISPGSKHKDLAAEFIRLMHREDRYNALWDDLGAIPADDRFNPNKIDDPLIRETWNWVENSTIYVGDTIPWAILGEAAYVGCQELFAGMKSPRELGEKAQRLAEQWREQNPDMLQNYFDWLEGLSD